MSSGRKAMSNSRDAGGCGQKNIPVELAASGRAVAGAVLIFAEPPGAARRGPAGPPPGPALGRSPADPEAVPAAAGAAAARLGCGGPGAGSNTP